MGARSLSSHLKRWLRARTHLSEPTVEHVKTRSDVETGKSRGFGLTWSGEGERMHARGKETISGARIVRVNTKPSTRYVYRHAREYICCFEHELGGTMCSLSEKGTYRLGSWRCVRSFLRVAPTLIHSPIKEPIGARTGTNTLPLSFDLELTRVFQPALLLLDEPSNHNPYLMA